MISMIGQSCIAVPPGVFDGHVGINPEKYEDQYGGYGCRVKNKQGKKNS